MNNVYYGVSPSSDFFAHFGIKGMRWGIRRAIKRGNHVANKKHHSKAKTKVSNKHPYNGLRKDIKTALKAAALSTVMGPGAAIYMNSRQIARDAKPIKNKKRRKH